MTTLWIHAGAFTTDTSRIQNAAYAARDALRLQGWLYPTAGIVADEPDVGLRHSRLVYLHPEAWGLEVATLIDEIRTTDPDHVLLSSEAWSRPSAGPALDRLLSALQGAGVIDRAHALLFLRNRCDYARGVFGEMTRRRGNMSDIKAFIARRPAMFDPLAVVHTLSSRVDSLTVFNYDTSPDPARQLFDHLGVTVPLSAPEPSEPWDAVRVAAQRHMSRLARGLTAPPGEELLPGQPASMYGEWVPPSSLPPIDDIWRTAFAGLTGWPEADITELVGSGRTPLRDVADIDRLLAAAVDDWLLARRIPQVHVTPLTRALDWQATASFVNADTPEVIDLTGRALLTEPIDAMWWIPEDRSPRTRLTVGLASPGLGAHRPDLPHAHWARFEGRGLRLESRQPVAIVAETVAGMTKLAQVVATPRDQLGG